MPRGARKSSLEKLQEEIKLEEFKKVSAILEEKNMSISELKDILISKEEGLKDE